MNDLLFAVMYCIFGNKFGYIFFEENAESSTVLAL